MIQRALEAVNIVRIRQIIPLLLKHGQEHAKHSTRNFSCMSLGNIREFSKSGIKRICTSSKLNEKKMEPTSPIPLEEEKIMKINTKSGNLTVRTTLLGTQVQNLVIEKEPKKESTDGPNNPVPADPVLNTKPKLTERELLAEKNKEMAKKRVRVNFALSSLARNFITPPRAMSDFLLKASDLEALPKTKRRSPYEQEPPITVYWRKDVEAKSIEIWGTRENLLKELLKREVEKKMHQQSIV